MTWDPNDHQGKREDQVSFSDWVVTLCLYAALVFFLYAVAA